MQHKDKESLMVVLEILESESSSLDAAENALDKEIAQLHSSLERLQSLRKSLTARNRVLGKHIAEVKQTLEMMEEIKNERSENQEQV